MTMHLIVLCALAAIAAAAKSHSWASAPQTPAVGAIYFGAWHVDKNRAEAHGDGWLETWLVTNATARFEGQIQPNIPAWEYNESTREDAPEGMGMRMRLANDSGVDFFLFDWYWYEELGPKGKGGPFLDGALNGGFLPALKAGDELGFALMWANQDWVDVHPAKAGYHATSRESNATVPPNMLLRYDGFMAPSVYEAAFDYIVEQYFANPKYLRLPTESEGGRLCPYFAFYQVEYLVTGSGGTIETAAALLRSFRAKAKANPAVGCVHIAGMDLEQFSETDVKQMGIDSATHYGWMKTSKINFPSSPYKDVATEAMGKWAGYETQWGVPYVPSISVAWDSSPRCAKTDTFADRGYPWGGATRSTPAEFATALGQAKTYVENRCAQAEATGFCPPLLINAWSEWSEGAYLEPDQREGYARINAVKSVFKA